MTFEYSKINDRHLCETEGEDNDYFFLNIVRRAEERLLRVIETVVSEEDIKIYRTIGSFSRGLRQPRNDYDIAILLASSKVELHYLNLISLRNLLSDMKIIVILPDSNTGHHCKRAYIEAEILELLR